MSHHPTPPDSVGWVMLTSTVVPAGMLPLANLVLWWWEGLRDVATLANLVLCMVEGRRGGEGEG